MIKILSGAILVALVLTAGCDCGTKGKGNGPTNGNGPSTGSGYVLNKTDSTGVEYANIIVYDANTNSPVTRILSASDGAYSFDLDEGTYYLKVTAQGFFPSPPPDGAPIPFQVAAGGTTWCEDIYLTPDPSAVGLGYIYGYVLTPDTLGISSVLVVATNLADSSAYSGASGPDGYYVIYNVPSGDYHIGCYRAGYLQDTVIVTVSIGVEGRIPDVDLTMVPRDLPSLVGKITFRAVTKSVWDVTLVHPVTRDAVPGLQVFSDTTLHTYEITQIPYGTFIAWASYRNDGYVMDPDWLFKNGLPYVTFTEGDSVKLLDFTVTNAITITYPTNAGSSIVPIAVASVDTFKWEAYAGTKEYIIAVYNSSGELIWGGFDSNGTINHPQIDFHNTQVAFNFDNSATSTLKPGETYRWKVWADNSTDPNIQILLSSSEDLLGLFKIK